MRMEACGGGGSGAGAASARSGSEQGVRSNAGGCIPHPTTRTGEMSPNSIPKYLKRPLWRERKCGGAGSARGCARPWDSGARASRTAWCVPPPPRPVRPAFHCAPHHTHTAPLARSSDSSSSSSRPTARHRVSDTTARDTLDAVQERDMLLHRICTRTRTRTATE